VTWTSPACHDRLSPFSDFAEPSTLYSLIATTMPHARGFDPG
jgi:hypothetical protein